MDADLLAMLTDISNRLKGVEAVLNVTAAHLEVPAPAAPVVVAVPKRVYAYDARGLLKDYLTGPGGSRQDPIVDADCPSARRVASGKYLSLARPDLGEQFTGYCSRVSLQAGGANLNNMLGAIMMMGMPMHEAHGGFKADGSNWPDVADNWANAAAYQSDPQRAQAAASAAQFDAAMQAVADANKAQAAPESVNITGN